MINPDVVYAFIVGSIPSASMLFASFALYNYTVEPIVEASCTYFTAGLIIAAVAAELFPLMTPPPDSGLELQYFGGTTIGFLMGVAMINGVAQLIEVFESADDDEEEGQQRGICSSSYWYGFYTVAKEKVMGNIAYGKSVYNSLLGYTSVDENVVQTRRGTSMLMSTKMSPAMAAQLRASYIAMSSPPSEASDLENTNDTMKNSGMLLLNARKDESSGFGNSSGKSNRGVLPDLYDEIAVRNAATAIAAPAHRARIKTIFVEIMDSIDVLESKTSSLYQEGAVKLTVVECEVIQERIDQEIHQLHYRLDHARRLLEGSEAAITRRNSYIKSSGNVNGSEKWMESRERLEEILGGLKTVAFHLMGHLNDPQPITIDDLVELHEHVDIMDKELNQFHQSTEEASFKWRRLAKTMPVPIKGSFVPPALVIPVTIDGFFDGFLIGIACSLSRRAALILAIANCLEMAFLGMAVAMRVRKCTGSAAWVRYGALIAPPVMMWLAAAFGACVGSASRSYPIIFVSFVGFGVIALLYLVINELLVEARETMEEVGKVWYVECIIFVGIYVVISIDKIVG